MTIYELTDLVLTIVLLVLTIRSALLRDNYNPEEFKHSGKFLGA